MYPILFTIGSLQLHAWGAMLAVSLSLGISVISRMASARGYDRDRLVNSVLVLIAVGVVGARLLYVLTNAGEFAGTGLLGMLDLRTGGMAFHGALFAGMAALPFLARYVGMLTIRFADILVPGLALGYGVQRIGCFLNGDSFGITTNVPWAVATRFAPGLRHPVQLYDSAMNIGLFLLLLWYSRRKPVDGRMLAVYLAGSGLARFLSEFLRDGPRLQAWVTPAQVVSLALVLTAAVGFVLSGRRKPLGQHAG